MFETLDRYCGPDVVAGQGLGVFIGRRQAGADDVHQGLAYFAGAGTHNLALLIFDNVNPAGRLKGKNHWPRVHALSLLLFL